MVVAIPPGSIPGYLDRPQAPRLTMKPFDPDEPIAIKTVRYRLSLVFKSEFDDEDIVVVYREEPL